jgi:uncharacterized delta-60 repeat protein
MLSAAALIAGAGQPPAAPGFQTTVDFNRGVDSATAVAIQPDGKLVVAGWSSLARQGSVRFAVSRHLPDGNLDTSFGRAGRVTTDLGESAAEDVVLQPDGKIVVAGRASGGMAVARYEPDGTLDRSFAGDGKRVIRGACMQANAVAVAPDGGLLLAGSAGCGGESADLSLAVARLRPDGGLDRAFAGDGVRTVRFSRCTLAFGLTVQPDGKVVVGGGDGGCFEQRTWFRAVRLDPDGTLDQGFARPRVRFTSPHASAYDLALDPRGNVLLAGTAAPADGSHRGHARFALARLSSGGRLDRGFGAAGRTTSLVGDESSALAVALLPDGRVALAGGTYTALGAPAGFALAIFSPDGGQHETRIVKVGRRSQANDVAVDAQGQIVLVGQTGDRDFAIARVAP